MSTTLITGASGLTGNLPAQELGFGATRTLALLAEQRAKRG